MALTGTITSAEDILNSVASDNKLPIEGKKIKVKKMSNFVDNVRGIAKSGRIWKSTKTRTNTLIQQRGLKLNLKKSNKLREELRRAKQLSRSVRELAKQQSEVLRERQKFNAERKLANERKAEIVQVINNPKKLKKMKKKQLRLIEKRDTLNMQQK